MSVDSRHCDKCNLEVPRGTILTTLCVDGLAHHLVDNIPAPAHGNVSDYFCDITEVV